MNADVYEQLKKKVDALSNDKYTPKNSAETIAKALDSLPDMSEETKAKIVENDYEVRNLAEGKLTQEVYPHKEGKEARISVYGDGKAWTEEKVAEPKWDEKMKVGDHILSQKEKDNLRYRSQAGFQIEVEGKKCLVSYDTKTHRIKARAVEDIKSERFARYFDHKFTEEEQKALMEGKAVIIDRSKKNGEIEKVAIQYDAFDNTCARGRNIKNYIPKYGIGGASLSDEQVADLAAGKVVMLKGIKKKDSEERFDAEIALGPYGLDFASKVLPQKEETRKVETAKPKLKEKQGQGQGL